RPMLQPSVDRFGFGGRQSHASSRCSSGLAPRTRGSLLLVAGLGVPAIVLRAAGNHPDSIADAAVFGVGVVGASLLLAWAGEAAEVDLGQGVAIAILALIAVLPEYAVDLVLAIKAGGDPETYGPLAAANMTGSNRLLIGVGWAAVAILAIGWQRRNRPDAAPVLMLHEDRAVEFVFLGAATLYSMTIPLRHLFGVNQLNLVDSVVLVAIFVLYLRRLGGQEQQHDSEMPGIPAHIS